MPVSFDDELRLEIIDHGHQLLNTTIILEIMTAALKYAKLWNHDHSLQSCVQTPWNVQSLQTNDDHSSEMWKCWNESWPQSPNVQRLETMTSPKMCKVFNADLWNVQSIKTIITTTACLKCATSWNHDHSPTNVQSIDTIMATAMKCAKTNLTTNVK